MRIDPVGENRAQEHGRKLVGVVITVAVLLFGSVWNSISSAQTYPTRPVKLIVPFPPGGPTDIVARVTAQKLSEGLSQQIVVENRAGAGGTIGAQAVATSSSDGYTLLFGTTGTLAGAPNLYTHVGYDPVGSFAPISLISIAPLVIVVHPSVPAATLREFIELAKSKPGQINAGSAGSGTPPHIAVEIFKSIAGIDLLHIPYKGTAAAVMGLVAGDVQIFMDQFNGSLQQQVRAGKLRALAVTSSKRLPQLPDLPTATEAGVPGLEVSGWTGLLAPKETAGEIIRQLNAEVRKALATKEVGDIFANQGLEPLGSTPQQFSAFIDQEISRWSRAIKSSGARLD